MSKDTGGYAFPGLNAECTGIDSDGQERWNTEQSGGMTLRDYFAAQALSGLAGCADTAEWTPEAFAETAYDLANAMIAERAK